MDSENLNPPGFSWVKVFHGDEEMPDRNKRNYKKQAIEEKESYKWIEVPTDKRKGQYKRKATIELLFTTCEIKRQDFGIERSELTSV